LRADDLHLMDRIFAREIVCCARERFSKMEND
jgi:hypothetical protein